MESHREVLPNSADQKLIEEKDANIYAMPKARKNAKGTAIIGDLHGNAIKLLYFLIHENILELDADPEKYPEGFRKKISGKPEDLYKELVKIYEKDPDFSTNSLGELLGRIDSYTANAYKVKENYFTTVISQLEKEDLDFFKAIISNAKITNKRKIILIGDEFCDRGHNDYLTLKIIEKLKKESVPYEILLSNHGAEFYGFFLNPNSLCVDQNGANDSDYLNKNNLTRYILQPAALIGNDDHSLSLQNLGALISRKLITLAEVKDLIKNCCLPNLKLLSYVETQDGQLGICSHAPIGLETIQGLASALGLKYTFNFQDKENIKKIIDAINEKFQSILPRLNLKLLLQLCPHVDQNVIDYKNIQNLKNIIESDDSSDFSFLEKENVNAAKLIFHINTTIWNRNRDYLIRSVPHFFWINGHDQSNNPEKYQNEVCLDNNCGKKASDRTHIMHHFQAIETEFKKNQVALLIIEAANMVNCLQKYNHDAIKYICEPFKVDLTLPKKIQTQIHMLLVEIHNKPSRISDESITLLNHLVNSKMAELARQIATGSLWPLKNDCCDNGPYCALEINENPAELKVKEKPIDQDNNNAATPLSYLWTNQAAKPSSDNLTQLLEQRFKYI